MIHVHAEAVKNTKNVADATNTHNLINKAAVLICTTALFILPVYKQIHYLKAIL